MGEQLKPCPFCGGEAKPESDVIYWMVACTTCTANVGWWDAQQLAIAAWNRRPTNPEGQE